MEWADIIKNNENTQNEECLSTKVQIPKFSRPSPESLTEEVAIYKKLVETKLRNLGPKVEEQYPPNNNLPFHLKLAKGCHTSGIQVFCPEIIKKFAQMSGIFVIEE